MGRYVLSKQAVHDLVGIYRYSYANYGERHADVYAGSLKQKCQFLADNPLLLVARTEFKPPVRLCHHKKHLIIYTLEAEVIFIVRFLHERMNVGECLGG